MSPQRQAWTRSALVAALLAGLSMTGCGGKLGGKKTTPGSKGTVATEKVGGAPGDKGDKAEKADGAPGDKADKGQKRKSSKRKKPDALALDDPFDPESDDDETDEDDEPAKPTKPAKPDAGKERATGEQPTAERKPPPPPPKIKPPDLDLPAADQARRVEGQLVMARRALTATTPDPDRALEAARAALEIDATSIDAVALMAHAYHAKGFDDTAEVMLDMLYRERERARQNPAVFYVYGLIYDATDRAERAMSAYYQAVQIEPGHRAAMTNLGAHYLRKKMFAEATLVYEKLTGELGVKSAVAWTNLGAAYRGRAAEFPVGSPNRDAFLREAETAFKRAMSSDRGYANTYYNLGLLYLDADPFPGASKPMDTLQRLGQARTYFEEYGRSRGADRDLMTERIKDVDKLIKREKKRQKRDSAGEDW
ncbi:MAG TPA: tetratricopeptide repeat protein [Haliangium sp.]|nr:tetratricopeptide repeat protein [Haliangium sp.]